MRLIRSFFSMEGANPVMVVGCLLLAGLFHGIGLTGLLPVLSLISDQAGAEPNRASQLIAGIFALFSWEVTLGSLLAFVGTAIMLKCLMHFLAMRKWAMRLPKFARCCATA